METNVGNAATGTGDEFMNLHICKRKKKLMRHPLSLIQYKPHTPKHLHPTQPPSRTLLFFLFPIRALDENLVLYQVFSFLFFRFSSCVQNENVFFYVYMGYSGFGTDLLVQSVFNKWVYMITYA